MFKLSLGVNPGLEPKLLAQKSGYLGPVLQENTFPVLGYKYLPLEKNVKKKSESFYTTKVVPYKLSCCSTDLSTSKN